MNLLPDTPTPNTRLRDYQHEAVTNTLALYRTGTHRVLGVAATGTGKSVILATLASTIGRRTLVIAHRDELLTQLATTIRDWWPDVTVGIVKGDRFEADADVVVASIQTIGRPKRLAALLGTGLEPFGLVIIDEAHHARAQQYQTVIEAMRAGEPDGPYLYGTTATPDRADKQGLADIFDAVAFNYDIGWALEHGHLANIRARSIDIGLDLRDVKTRGGDFVDTDLDRAMREIPTADRVVEQWKQHGQDRKTIAFLPSVALATEVAEAFRDAGIRSEVIHGALDPVERRQVLARFKTGQVHVLSNCMVATEGFDEPSITCVLLARPTKSRSLYAQMAGRGTRLHPGKDDCLLLDLVGAAQAHSLITAADLLGVTALLDGQTATEALEQERANAEAAAAAEAEQLAADLEVGQLQMVDVDPLGRPRGRRYAWIHAPIPTCPSRWSHTVTLTGELTTQTRDVIVRPEPGP